MTLKLFGSFALAAIAAFALTVGTYIESFNWARLAVVLAILLALHLLRYPRVLFCREFALYFMFVGYLVVALLWTDNILLAMNTIVPAIDFALTLVLFGSLAAFHDSRAVFAGALAGFLGGAVMYSVTRGFPLVVPADFSYNGVAGMYLFGLFLTLTFGWTTRRVALAIPIGVILMVHILVTTSIKVNLGIVLGAVVVGAIYFGHFAKLLWKHALSIVALAGALAYAVVSNTALVENIQAGAERVALGVEILSNRHGESGYTGYEKRQEWAARALAGWSEHPLQGNGVEALRADVGITSHSTPADLLYNYGLIGFALFYALFVSAAWRLFRTRGREVRGIRVLLTGVIVCYLFISLSSILHYVPFFAVVIAVCAALVREKPARLAPERPSRDAQAGASAR